MIIDTNKNGTLEKSEIESFFKQMAGIHGQVFSKREFDLNWHKMDVDQNGIVSEEELYKYMFDRAIKDGTMYVDDSDEEEVVALKVQ